MPRPTLPGMPTLLHTQAELDAWRASTPGTVALVPTMGALHEGHLSLARAARAEAAAVVVSIFVNPRQFGAGEDFERYPRTRDADVSALAGIADVVFAPSVHDVYPPDTPVRTFEAGPGGDGFEGAARPGHFDGMLTVVARLFDLVAPDVAVFGQKDAQQVFLVRRLVAQHYPRLRLVVAPTVRELDGVAMSSRNRFLSHEDRIHARALNRALSFASGDPAVSVPRMRAELEAETGITIDYVAAVDPHTFEPVSARADAQQLEWLTYVVAARVGSTRLLDTIDVEVQK